MHLVGSLFKGSSSAKEERSEETKEFYYSGLTKALDFEKKFRVFIQEYHQSKKIMDLLSFKKKDADAISESKLEECLKSSKGKRLYGQLIRKTNKLALTSLELGDDVNVKIAVVLMNRYFFKNVADHTYGTAIFEIDFVNALFLNRNKKDAKKSEVFDENWRNDRAFFIEKLMHHYAFAHFFTSMPIHNIRLPVSYFVSILKTKRFRDQCDSYDLVQTLKQAQEQFEKEKGISLADVAKVTNLEESRRGIPTSAVQDRLKLEMAKIKARQDRVKKGVSLPPTPQALSPVDDMESLAKRRRSKSFSPQASNTLSTRTPSTEFSTSSYSTEESTPTSEDEGIFFLDPVTETHPEIPETPRSRALSDAAYRELTNSTRKAAIKFLESIEGDKEGVKEKEAEEPADFSTFDQYFQFIPEKLEGVQKLKQEELAKKLLEEKTKFYLKHLERPEVIDKLPSHVKVYCAEFMHEFSVSKIIEWLGKDVSSARGYSKHREIKPIPEELLTEEDKENRKRIVDELDKIREKTKLFRFNETRKKEKERESL